MARRSPAFFSALCFRLALVPVAVLLVQAGCNKEGESGKSSAPVAAAPPDVPPVAPLPVGGAAGPAPGPGPATTPPTKPAGGQPAAASFGKPASVVLLEPGKAPRRALRYSPRSAAKEKISMTMSMVVDIPTGTIGKSVEMRLPSIRMVMELSVAEKLSDEEVRCKFAVVGADVLPGDKVFDGRRDSLKVELKKMVGAAGTLILDHRGINREMALTLPSDMDPQMRQTMESGRQAMEQLAAPLPEEPVGMGARWQVDQLIEQSRLKLKQKAVFELVKIKGSKATLKKTITQIAEPQMVMDLPSLPAGLAAEVLSHSGSGIGYIDVDLTQLAARKMTTTVKTDTSIKVTGQGVDQDLRMKAETQVDISHL